MSKIQTFRKLWHSDKTAILTACFNNLNNLGLFRWIGDKTFLSIAYYMHTGRRMNWIRPERFTEKIQWLKLYDRKSEYTQMVDKITAKEYVASVIGWEYIIPTYGVWDSFNEIDFDKLPDQFVLKTSNGSGSNGVVVCTDKRKLDKAKAKKQLESSLKCNTYLNLREWPYKNIVPKIFAEQYICNQEVNEIIDLRDYKFFCSNGECKLFKIDFDRFVGHKANYYNRNGDLLPFGEVVCPPDPSVKIEIPSDINEMIEIAERLSKGLKLLRVDLYNTGNKILFGELTFYPASGFEKFVPDEGDFEIGKLISID